MLFQPLDDKKFIGVYADGTIHRADLPEGLSATWKFCSSVPDDNIVYANLYCGGQSLDETCPDFLLPRWKHISHQLEAHLSACRAAKVDLQNNSFLDLVPDKLLLEFCEVKNQITEHVLANHPRPKNYDFLLGLEQILEDIRGRKINLNLEVLGPSLTTTHSRVVYKRLKNIQPFIDYDAFKTKTGRLTTKKRSFPILTLNKTFRRAIEPNNDYFVELDFNAAELRTLLALSGKEQPQTDIHVWNAEHVYRGMVTREEAKKRIFAWLYNPASNDNLSNRAYDRGEVLAKYWDGKTVKTFFDREIEADEHHAVNYIIQSTTSDLFLRRVVEVGKILRERRSYIAFTLHDSLVIDYANEDKDLLRQIVETYKNTDLGEFAVNISVGENFGEMRKLKV